jgi:RNA polymerase sigma factor (sigma-70 family)
MAANLVEFPGRRERVGLKKETTACGEEIAKPLSLQAACQPVIFDEAYVVRLRCRDEETSEHFNAHFRKMLHLKLYGKFSRELEEEVANEVLCAAITKILQGEPRDPTKLAAYVAGVCANITKKTIRDRPKREWIDANLDQISNEHKTPEEQVLAKANKQVITRVLGRLKDRDRNILVDLFYHELDREEILEKYRASRQQLRMIVFHARQRFQKEWENETPNSSRNEGCDERNRKRKDLPRDGTH